MVDDWRSLEAARARRRGLTGRVSAFVLPDEYVELRASLRRLAEDTIAPNAAEADEREEYPWA